MDRTQAFNIAIAAIRYRRAIRQADSAAKRIKRETRGQIAYDVADLNAAEQTLVNMRDELADTVSLRYVEAFCNSTECDTDRRFIRAGQRWVCLACGKKSSMNLEDSRGEERNIR